MENIWIAAIVAFFGLLTAGMPVLLARQANKATAEAIAAANLRADLLAERVALVAKNAEAAARLLVTNTASVAQAAKDTSEKLEAVSKGTSDKLDVIHLLVNSNMTVAKQAEYDATVSQLAMMHEMIDLKRAGGKEPNAMTVTALAATEAKVADLRKELDERARQAKAVEKQQDIQKQEALAVKIGELPNGTILDHIPNRPVE